MRLVAVDPGVMTGVFMYDTETDDARSIETCDISVLYRLLDDFSPSVVIVEDFRLYPWRAAELAHHNMPSAEVIGAVSGWCAINNIAMCRQQPAVRKTVPGRWLEAFSVPQKTKGMPHARDAARHLVYYLVKNDPDMKRRLSGSA